MGHNVRSTNGGAVGGYQAVMFAPAPGESVTADGPIKGFYRAGSDHRKDGQAVAY